MKVFHVPIIKNKTLISAGSRNYRPFALATAALNLFEHILQNRVSSYLDTSDAQLGLKASQVIDMTIFSTEQSVKIHLNSLSHVFICSRDASRTFDRIGSLHLYASSI